MCGRGGERSTVASKFSVNCCTKNYLNISVILLKLPAQWRAQASSSLSCPLYVQFNVKTMTVCGWPQAAPSVHSPSHAAAATAAALPQQRLKFVSCQSDGACASQSVWRGTNPANPGLAPITVCHAPSHNSADWKLSSRQRPLPQSRPQISSCQLPSAAPSRLSSTGHRRAGSSEITVPCNAD